jgi:ADP-heptose:LPS heptosyltransferase
MSSRPTALVLRALGLGDFFTGLPALRLLRNALPEHHIVLAVPDWLAPLALLAGSVDATVPAHELQPILDPPARPALALDLHGNGPESRALLAVTEPTRLIAYGPGGPTWQPAEHEVHRWCRLVGEGLGLPGWVAPSVVGALPPVPDVFVPAGTTVVHCGAKSRARRWPPPRFAPVARKLAADGHHVIITGAPEERELAESIAAASGVQAMTNLNLPQLVNLIARARLIICGDTGVAHIASNYRTPSVILFGPVSPTLWGPPADPRHQVLWHGDGYGDPHAADPDPALLRVSVDEVLTASERALGHSEPEPVRER